MLLASAGCLYVKSSPDKVEARRIELSMLGTPTEVAVRVANRRLTVAWGEMPGAASYKIAVRPKNQLVPKWREYTATSAPYIADRWAMSGMEYEVRVAAVNGRGQSEWSDSVSITAPVLQAAPDNAISIASSPLVGEFIVVDLHSQRPFENRSVWHWFICGADGSDCKVLPRRSPYQSQPTWEYFVEPAMEGKHLSVQVDYDKEGGSYSATAGLGVVGAARDRELTTRELATPDDEGVQGRELATHLYALDLNGVYFRSWEGESRGAIAPLGNDLLVASPWGMLALVRPNRAVAYLDGNVPMNVSEFQAHPDKANLRLHQFRVADILLKQHSVGRYELFVTHHYFTGECIRFRLSATTLLQQGADISVSPAWRTIFDADPCVSAASEQAGGRMLTDGPDHLLVVIGTHGQDHYAQDPASHLGKLVRIEIETGRALILASGLRNPQGLTRDAAGTLWETEHGPHGGDELNILELGGNYGWPQVTYGIESGSWVKVSRVEKLGRHDGFTKPVFSWLPSIGISNLVVNDERWFPLWEDDLLIGSLVGNALFRVRLDGAAVQYVERIKVGYRIRDLAHMPDGRIALLGDGEKVYFLSRSYAYCNDEDTLNLRPVYAVDCAATVGSGVAATVGAVAATGAQLYGTHCSGCHSLTVEKHGIGPHLVGVVGRRAGEVSGYLFSGALRSLDLAWTPTHLEQFLADPKQFAPGTSKSLHITQAEARAIVDFIEGD